MPGPNAAALRTADFPTACWSCIIKQRRQLRHLSNLLPTPSSSVHEPPAFNTIESPPPVEGLPLRPEQWAWIRQQKSQIQKVPLPRPNLDLERKPLNTQQKNPSLELQDDQVTGGQENKILALREKPRAIQWRRRLQTPFGEFQMRKVGTEVPVVGLYHHERPEVRISFHRALGTKLETKDNPKRKLAMEYHLKNQSPREPLITYRSRKQPLVKDRPQIEPSVTYHPYGPGYRKVPFNKPEENLWELLELYSSKSESNNDSTTQEVSGESARSLSTVPHSHALESLGKTRPALGKQAEAISHQKRSFHSSRVVRCSQYLRPPTWLT